MASRTPLLTIQYYDRDGGLDWAIHGSQWSEWYTDQLTRKSKSQLPAPEGARLAAKDSSRIGGD